LSGRSIGGTTSCRLRNSRSGVQLETQMSKVVIFGTGSFAEVVCYLLTHDSEHEVVAFTANESHIVERVLMGLPVVPFETLEREYPPDSYKMYVAIAYKDLNKVRACIYADAKQKG